MANFCTQCGKAITDCTCNQNKTFGANGTGNFDPIPNPAPYPNPNPAPAPNPNPAPQPNPNPNPPIGVGGSIVIDTDKIKQNFNKKRVSFKEYVGLNESEMTDNSDPYERGLNVVPDIVAPCDGEVPIKQYDIGRFRSFFSFKWAEARIQVTNKRVIFRCSGKSPFGKDFTQSEHSIDELIGLNFSKGVRFSFLTAVVVMFINTFVAAAGVGFSSILNQLLKTNIVSALIGLAGFAGLVVAMIFLRKKYFYNALIAMAATSLNAGAITSVYRGNAFFAGLSIFMTVVCGLILLYFTIKVALKPSASITFTTRNASKDIMGMFSPRIAKSNISAEILPASDTEAAFAEISAIINDVQKMGDYAIEKWQKK